MVFTTERLLLREFMASDWQAVLAYQRDPRYLRYYHWTERTEEDVRRFVQLFLNQQRERPRRKFQLAIVLKANNQLIGNCGIRMQTAEAREAEIGYEVSPEHWGHGYATEAAQVMLTFGFEQLGLHRIWAHCIAENVASARVLAKIGMQGEGRLREKEWIKGRWWDTLLFAILEHEWRVKGKAR